MPPSTRLRFGSHTYACQPGETVLEALLRQGVRVPHDCRRQTCLTCLMRSLDGAPPPESQAPLKETLRVQNYFLACGCRPIADMTLALPTELPRAEIGARVAELNRLSGRILEIVLDLDHPLDYRGGQSVILLNPDGLGNSFAIATPTSRRHDGRIELHVERVDGNCLSEWLHDRLRLGDRLRVYGPTGQMFHVPLAPRQGVVLAAWSGALGGILAILQDIFEQEHMGPVLLLHGARDPSDLYLVDDIREIEDYYPNFRYVGCAGEGSAKPADVAAGVSTALRARLPRLEGWRVYLSGPAEFVEQLRRQAYLDGASIREIFFHAATD